ncbi:hypothetical protein EVAR_13999_1 [Eumeta japonica]|uniref:PiggyBac transposable element-derived protein domain-containing protein n=1 Tax=Eumeta variegata TaxID=151549 RepID=A0A4C1U9I0_EUMVA|nr:hypothetical protein EVAR_13999_1 [Eumeta japonica]
MASHRRIEDGEISRLLLETSDEETLESDSEIEDTLLQDDVQSDGEDCEHQSLRGKDGHRWTATKGRTCSRVSVCNIIRTSKGPTRMNKCFYDPIECFSIFITDDMEKIKWTNAEIQLKMQLRPDVKATFKPTICEEIRAL